MPHEDKQHGQKTALTDCEAAFKKSNEAGEHPATAEAFRAFRAGWYARADATAPPSVAQLNAPRIVLAYGGILIADDSPLLNDSEWLSRVIGSQSEDDADYGAPLLTLCIENNLTDQAAIDYVKQRAAPPHALPNNAPLDTSLKRDDAVSEQKPDSRPGSFGAPALSSTGTHWPSLEYAKANFTFTELWDHGRKQAVRSAIEPKLPPIPAIPAESGWQCPGCQRCYGPGKWKCDYCGNKPLKDRIRSY